MDEGARRSEEESKAERGQREELFCVLLQSETKHTWKN